MLHSQTPSRVAIDPDDIGGVVTGPAGPEAGVWVIAEMNDLSTRFRKIVVTDQEGRYVLPDLPRASYSIWVRGYGLVDSPKTTARPGSQLALKAIVAPTPQAAAQYFPGNYWVSLIKPPAESEFPLAVGSVPAGARGGRGGRGGGAVVGSQLQWIGQIKMQGLAFGSKATRELNPALAKFNLPNTEAALRYAVTAGQIPEYQIPAFGFPAIADWMDRIKAGAIPPTPPRPAGAERNVVISEWDVANDHPFMHDVAASDKRQPNVNAYGHVYGVDFHNDGLIDLDPLEHKERTIPIPAQVDKTQMRTFRRQTMDAPSLIWGEEVVVRDHSNPNHVTLDAKGRVWLSAAVNVAATPAFCREGSANRYAQAAPLTESNRHLAMFDPKTEKWTLIHTCFRTHHVQFAVDGTNRLFANGLGGSGVAMFGWLDVDQLDKTGDQRAAQGWCQLYFDVDGDGRPDRDRPVPGAPYSIIQNPADRSLWGAVTNSPGHIVRLSLGANPPETCVGEMYEVPYVDKPSTMPGAPSGSTPRGIDVDSEGVVWTALAYSGHLASFDRRKCKVLKGETITTGRQCPEGWTLRPTPGPRMQGVTAEINADFHYYNFVDQKNALGLGPDTPIVNGTHSDSLIAWDRRMDRFVVMRVPYPLGFHQRGMSARIDDPRIGWKGRGIWATNGTLAMWQTEGGKGTRGMIAKFQMRPNPLAK
jgi:hypothetical protein